MNSEETKDLDTKMELIRSAKLLMNAIFDELDLLSEEQLKNLIKQLTDLDNYIYQIKNPVPVDVQKLIQSCFKIVKTGWNEHAYNQKATEKYYEIIKEKNNE